MLICEMAAFYRTKGISLIEARKRMYAEYGVYFNKLDTFTCEGESGMERMSEIMSDLRKNGPKSIGGLAVEAVADYEASVKTYTDGKTEQITLPKSNVITFFLQDNASVVIRPSGTEPKIKVYYTTTGAQKSDAVSLQEKLSTDFTKILGF